MKIGKCILVFLVFCAALLLTGEIYRGYCMNFDEYYYVEFTDIEKGYYEQRFEFVCNRLKEYNIDVFVADSVSRGDGEELINIYCSDSVREKLMKEYLRYEGTVGSFFAESVSVHYYDLSLFTKRDMVTRESAAIYCLYDGDIESLTGLPFQRFEPQRKADHVLHTNLLFVRIIWSAVFFLFLFLTALECRFQKKEWFVRLCHGYPGKTLLMTYLAEEMLSFFLPGLLSYALLHSCSALQFGNAYLLILISVFIPLDLSFVFISFYLMNHKAAMQSSPSSPKLLRFSYALRICVLAASIMILSSCVRQFTKLIPVLKAETFYRQYEGYAHIGLVYHEKYRNEENDYKRQFVQQYGDRYDAQYWSAGAVIKNLDGETTWIITANKRSKATLERLLPECADMDLEQGQYIFLPEQFAPAKLSEKDWKWLANVTGHYYEPDEMKIIIYHEEIETLAFTSWSGELLYGLHGLLSRDPIIVFNAVDNVDFYDSANHYFPLLNPLAVKITESELQQIVESDEKIMRYFYTDIYESFREAAAKYLQMGGRLLSIAVLVILLDILLISTIIKMEQKMNALEISLMKITGSPFHVRYRNVVQTTLTAGAMAVLATELIEWKRTQQFETVNLVVGVCFVALELSFVAVEIFRWENMQIQKILKGGCIS